MTPHPAARNSFVLVRLRTLWSHGTQLARNCGTRLTRHSRIFGALASIRTRTLRHTHSDGPDTDTSQSRSNIRANSRVVSWLSSATTRLHNVFHAAGQQSRLGNVVTGGRRFIEGSWLYRWLTAEPEPDVVVIDLRETFTVGPWLRLIQHALDWLLPTAVSSVLFRSGRRIHALLVTRPVRVVSLLLGAVAVGVLGTVVRAPHSSPVLVGLVVALVLVALAGTRVTWSWDELRETRGYHLLASAFEPPEPPESATQTDERQPEGCDDDDDITRQ